MSTIEQIEHAEETRKLIEEGQLENKELPEEAVEAIGAEPVTKGVHAPPPVKHVNDGPAVGTFAHPYDISANAATAEEAAPEGAAPEGAAPEGAAPEEAAPEEAAPEETPAPAETVAREDELPALETLTVEELVPSDIGASSEVVADSPSAATKSDVGLTTEGPATVVEVVDSAQPKDAPSEQNP